VDVRVAPNGVDGARFAPGPEDAALGERLGLPPGAQVLLTVSRLAPRKGHATTLRALARLVASRPRLRWVFTGAHPGLLREVLDLASTLGVASRIVPAGFLEPEELPALYRLARAFVLAPESDPDDVEGFGVALLEASASALPVVSTRTGGVPEAVEDGVTGLLVPPGDPEALAAALAKTLDDPALAARLGEAGRRRALERFSWARLADDVVAAWRTPPRPARPIAFARAADLLFRSEPALTSPSALERRRRLSEVHHPAHLLSCAREEADAERRATASRRERLRRSASQGKPVRLRATGAGAALLPEALEDARSAGVAAELEVKLRRFLEPTFRRHALPFASAVHLHHGVPAGDRAALEARVRGVPGEDLARVRSLRVHLAPEAQGNASVLAACVPEVHALRSLLSSRGVAVLPPPELMRWLSVTPAGGPQTAMIEPTNRCNLACPTCPTGTGKIAPRPDMSVDRFGRALEGLGRQVRNLALWNYGEPTLHRQLPALIAEAKRRGVGVVKVSSNVHFLDGEKGARLLESGLDVLILSVDGASEETYTRFRQNGRFAKVAAAVESLCAEKRRRGLTRPRIELQFIVMRHNAHEIPEIRRLAAAWGVDRLRLKSVGADDDANRSLVPAEAALTRYGADGETPSVRHPFCTMAWDHAVVNVDGSVTPCCWLRPDMGDAFVMGNAFEEPFAEIWRGPRYREFRRKMLEGREGMPVCGRCRGGTHDLLLSVEEVPS
jgi:radical SAM protein with 4Fe4S-binding SPASM domain